MTIVPFDDRDGTIWFDGKFVPWRDAKIHVMCHGLHYASSVFEGQRVYNGHIFKLREHTERLHKSGEILGFTIPYSIEAVEEACRQVLQKNNLKDAYIRLVAWRGPEQMGVAGQGTKIHMAIVAWEWPSYYPAEMLEKGIRLSQSSWRRPPPECAPTQSKAAGVYTIGTLAKREAEAKNYQDALMLDWRGNVTEATSANLFIVKDGKLHTPIPDCFLNGITRQTVIGLAKAHNIEVFERIVSLEDLKTADEVFLTGTAVEITAVGDIDETIYRVGPMTETLRSVFKTLTVAPS